MKKGFTLVELLAVIAILGILSIIVVPNALEAYQNSLKKAMQVQESKVVDAAKLYLEDYCSNKISSEYICPDNYVNDGYMCLSELQSPSSPLTSDNDGYIKSVLFKKDYCKGVIVFSEHTLKSYKDVKTYLYCGDSDNYSYVTDENFNASQYTKCGIENAVGNGETTINTCKDLDDSCSSMISLCNSSAYYEVMKNKCPVTCDLCDADKNKNEDTTTWQKVHSSNGYGDFVSVTPAEGGYVAAGYSYNSSAQGYDAILVKYDLTGNVVWEKSWGGTGTDAYTSTVKVPDGYMAVGYTTSTNVSGITNKGYYDAIIVKYDLNGNLVWQKNWGGSSYDFFNAITYSNNELVIGGSSYSSISGQFTNKGNRDSIIVAYDLTGNVKWQKNWGGSGEDAFDAIFPTSNGYLLAGWSKSKNISGITVNSSLEDAVIVSFGLDGKLNWNIGYGGSGADEFDSVASTDNGFIATGWVESTDINGISIKGGRDAVIVKYDENKNIVWQKNWGGSDSEWFTSVLYDVDSYVVVGRSKSTNISGITNKGGSDSIIAKYDLNGNMLLQKNYGGSKDDEFNYVITSNGNYVTVGTTNSANINGLTTSGVSNSIIIKYNSNLETSE